MEILEWILVSIQFILLIADIILGINGRLKEMFCVYAVIILLMIAVLII
jgi:hypothetical protein